MLYDSPAMQISLGLTLWDHHVLEEDIGDRPQPHSDFEIVASDSIEEKTSVLKVKGSLKASFLSGLVDVGGSAKYLNETKASKNQARVTLHYRATTRFRELSMNHLGEAHVQHSDIFDTSLATHVVTAILYGAQAFFVFDRDVTEKENHTDIQGDLQVMIEKIPNASIGGKGSVQVEEEHKTTVNKFSCRFYGDFCLQNPPTTFQGAVEVYRSLPKLLGPNGENAVPMKVWLLPLSFLDSNAAKLVRQISIALIQEVENILEDFIELETRCNDVLRTTVAQQFPEIGKDLRNFKNMSYQFKLEFQQSLAKQLPSIRGGGEEEAELAGILKMRCTSPFNRKNMTEWIDSKEREIYTLMSFTGMMKNTKIIQSLHDLYKESLKVKHVLCFVFTALGTTEPYLTALSDYLKDRTKKGSNHHPCSYDVEQDQWYTSKEIVDEMRIKAKLFGEFADANKENEDIRFLTVGLTNEKHRGSSIYFYKDGFSLSNNFMPPSEPETVTVGDMNHISVTLKISPPRYGAENVTSYSVEYRVRGEDGWKLETHLKSEEITVRDLRPNTEYEFRCRAIISAGVGPASKVSIRTEPCSPPGKPHVEPYEREILVSWKKPAEIGQNVQIIGYIVEYTTIPEEDLNVEALQWNQVRSITEKVIISELEPGTEYLVRLFWDFGAGSRSKESVTVNVTTKSSQCHKEFIKRTGKMTKSGSPSVYKLRLTKDDMNIDGCRRFIFGAECTAPNRTIMLFGGTGIRKTVCSDQLE
ncbi:verrucotoxin subunit beta-like [Pholidichthys leucotaenia]